MQISLHKILVLCKLILYNNKEIKEVYNNVKFNKENSKSRYRQS